MQKEDLWRQLGHAISVASSTGQVLWMQASVFWAANAVLVVALFQTGEFPKQAHVGFVVSLFGLGLTIIWRLLQDRMLVLLLRDETLLAHIQHRLGIETDVLVSRRLQEGEPNELNLRTFPAKKVLRHATNLCGLVWFVLLCGFMVAASR